MRFFISPTYLYINKINQNKIMEKRVIRLTESDLIRLVKKIINEQTSLNVDSLYYIVKDVLSNNKINQAPNKAGNSVTVLNKLPALYVSIYPSTDEVGKCTIRVSGEKREDVFKPQIGDTTNSGEQFIPPQTITRTNSSIRYDVSPDNLKIELGKLIRHVDNILWYQKPVK